MKSKKAFLSEAYTALEGIYDMVTEAEAMALSDLQAEKTALVMVDMINGFVKEGALSSPRVLGINDQIAALNASCAALGMQRLAFADCHTMESPEFTAYPPHCLKGTAESQITDEIAQTDGYLLIPKNSTNGFLEPLFQQWWAAHPQVDTFLIVGDCTDLCVYQFAVTLKTEWNRLNKNSQVIVPVNLVETYDLGLHNGDLMQALALYSMQTNGVRLVNFKQN